MLVTVIIRQHKQEQDLEEARFEQNMFLANREMYNEYMQNKREQIENGEEDIVWRTPGSIEEAHALDKIFADIDKQNKEDDDARANEDFVKQIGLMGLFGNIDIDQIGGD